MSTITDVVTRFFISFQSRWSRGCEKGQATSEYAVVILIAVALGLAVLALFTSGSMDDMLSGLMKKVLQAATGKIS